MDELKVPCDKVNKSPLMESNHDKSDNDNY